MNTFSKSEIYAPSRVSRVCGLLSPVLVTSLPQTHPTLTPAAPQLCSNKLSPCPWTIAPGGPSPDHCAWRSALKTVALCVKVTSSDASPTQSLSHPSLNYLHGSYLVSLSPSTVCLSPSQKNSSRRAGASCPPPVQCQAFRSHLINKYL